MTDTQYNAPLFGISINPTAKNVQHAFKLALILWPIGNEEAQIRTFAEEVVPALKERINSR